MLKEWTPQRYDRENAVVVMKNFLQLQSIPITETTIKKELRADPDRRSLLSLRNFLDRWDFETLAVQVARDQFKHVTFPAIALLKDHHFVVLLERQGRKVRYLHPKHGWKEVGTAKLFEDWDGYLIMATPGPKSRERDYVRKRKKELATKEKDPRRKKVQLVERFMSSRECRQLVDLAEPLYRRSRVVREEEEIVDDYRTSRTAFMRIDHPLIDKIYRKSSRLLKAKRENFEILQCACYKKNQEFRPHFDAHANKEYKEKHGQRLTTVLVSLNEDYEGGETFFPGLDLKVGPKTGRAIVFHSLAENGEIDNDSLHAGLPIFSGEKHVLTIWLRDRPN